ncbi:ribonuclease 1-like [Neltuma alba]|uniref:ribonuclease 1-like n=1 Tax=Neltuma alba TaxID=207710 RepID=UPI0010A2BD4C|nr:ribonuclease 1-like [Prosopis alba]
MSFWKRQWNKHGKRFSNKFNPQQYLRITINLARNHAKHIFDELVKQGIKPDGTTARRKADPREAVKQIMGYYPMLNIQLNDSGEHLLLEIRLCVNNDGVKLFHCDSLYIFAAP